MPRNLTGVVPKSTQLPAYPNWYTLPQRPVTWIQADHRVETEIDINDVGRVRVKPGYSVNIDEIRYGY